MRKNEDPVSTFGASATKMEAKERLFDTFLEGNVAESKGYSVLTIG